MKIFSSSFQTLRSLILLVSLKQKGNPFTQSMLICFLVLSLLSGCDGAWAKTEVGGKVSISGASASGILVEFFPVKEGKRFQGETDSEGAFILRCNSGKKLPMGKYKVLLHDYAPVDNFLSADGDGVDANKGKKSRVAPEFSSLKKTPLTREVSPSANFFSFELP